MSFKLDDARPAYEKDDIIAEVIDVEWEDIEVPEDAHLEAAYVDAQTGGVE
jgi:hypothetical protein